MSVLSMTVLSMIGRPSGVLALRQSSRSIILQSMKIQQFAALRQRVQLAKLPRLPPAGIFAQVHDAGIRCGCTGAHVQRHVRVWKRAGASRTEGVQRVEGVDDRKYQGELCLDTGGPFRILVAWMRSFGPLSWTMTGATEFCGSSR